MSTTMAPVPAPSMTGRPWSRRLSAALKGWWMAHTARRLENLAMLRLRAMSDRELKDIGIVRSGIAFAVRGQRDVIAPAAATSEELRSDEAHLP